MGKSVRCFTAFLATAGIGLAIGLFGCDKGTGPEPTGPRDYKAYFVTADGPSKLFAFHSLVSQVDSAELPWPASAGVTISADGRILYLNDGVTIRVVDAVTMRQITELSYSSQFPVDVSPDGRLVAITEHGLVILRTRDYKEVFSDSDATVPGHFSADSKSFYCPAGWVPGANRLPYVYRVRFDCTDTSVTRIGFSTGGVSRVVPSSDQSKLFLYVQQGLWRSSFQVFDVDMDSIIFQYQLIPGYGHIALTPDGRYVIISNPGRTGTDPPPPYGFSVFDVARNEIAHENVDTGFFGNSDPWWKSVPDFLAISPDSRWLFMMSGVMTTQVVYLWDINSNLPVRRWEGDNRAFLNLSVQFL